MLVEQKDVFYYVTRDCYKVNSCLCSLDEGWWPISFKEVTLPGSGAILAEVVRLYSKLPTTGEWVRK